MHNRAMWDFFEYLKKTCRLQWCLSVDRHLPVDPFQDLIVLSQAPLTMTLGSFGENACLTHCNGVKLVNKSREQNEKSLSERIFFVNDNGCAICRHWTFSGHTTPFPSSGDSQTKFKSKQYPDKLAANIILNMAQRDRTTQYYGCSVGM